MSRTPELPKGFHDENFQDKARHASDNKECIRLLGLTFIQEGLPEKEVAKLLKVNPRSVFDWLTRYKQGGIDALRDQGGRGRKNTLNDEQEKDFKNTILDLQEKREGGRIVGRDVKEVLKNSWLSANFVFELILPPDLVYQGIDRIPVCPETVSERTFLCLKYHSSVA